MDDEWYRLPDWDANARAEFERRLRRARSYNRAQYLRIKGVALEEAGHAAGARELWHRVLDDDGEFSKMHAWAAAEHLGDSYANSDADLAIKYYRRSMRRNKSLTMTSATQPIKIAELLLQRSRQGDLTEAKNLLMGWASKTDLPTPSARFRCHAALAEACDRTGDRDGARRAASRALALIDAPAPFPRHQDVGRVDADQQEVRRLEQLATAD